MIFRPALPCRVVRSCKKYRVGRETIKAVIAELAERRYILRRNRRPALRGSGMAKDHRMTGYAAYGKLGFEPIVETDGDCYARTKVRVRELYQSAELVKEALAKLPEGELKTPFKGNPLGEAAVRVEQPRGEVLYYLRGNGTDKLDRLRIRTPTFANIAPLLSMLVGCSLPDVAVIILSVDPCISCTER